MYVVFVRSRELSYSVADALCDLINSLGLRLGAGSYVR